MAKMLRYVSPRKKEIIFDNWEDERTEYGIVWVDMCPSCHNKFKGLVKSRAHNDGSGMASCSVKGCSNTNASWYVDFKENEVEFI